MNGTSQTGRGPDKKTQPGGKSPQTAQLGCFYSKFKKQLKSLKGKTHTHKGRTIPHAHSARRQTDTVPRTHSHAPFSFHPDCSPYSKHSSHEEAPTQLLDAAPRRRTARAGKIGSVGDRGDPKPPRGPARQREAVNETPRAGSYSRSGPGSLLPKNPWKRDEPLSLRTLLLNRDPTCQGRAAPTPKAQREVFHHVQPRETEWAERQELKRRGKQGLDTIKCRQGLF